MEDVFIYSHQRNEGKFIQDIVLAAFKMYAKFELISYHFSSQKSKARTVYKYEEGNTKYRCSVVVLSKSYPDDEEDEYLNFYTGSGDHVIEEYDGRPAFSLGSTEKISGNYNITLDWCIEYLKINPDHVVCSHEGHIFTLGHLLKAKEQGARDWLYYPPDNLLE